MKFDSSDLTKMMYDITRQFQLGPSYSLKTDSFDQLTDDQKQKLVHQMNKELESAGDIVHICVDCKRTAAMTTDLKYNAFICQSCKAIRETEIAGWKMGTLPCPCNECYGEGSSAVEGCDRCGKIRVRRIKR